MTDHTELKRLAEGAVRAGDHWGRRDSLERQLAKLVSPETVLTLIDENERLNAENKQLILLECLGGTAEAAINLLAERDQLKAESEALSKDSESYRLLSFCHGQGTLELVRSHHELCAEIRRLKILAGEPVPPTPEEFVGPSPEGPTARIRRNLAAMGKGEQS